MFLDQHCQVGIIQRMSFQIINKGFPATVSLRVTCLAKLNNE